ncbi:AAA family ATPase [Photobacterium angustum]|nr:AAA family ATPase [Photobacterium angustum]
MSNVQALEQQEVSNVENTVDSSVETVANSVPYIKEVNLENVNTLSYEELYDLYDDVSREEQRIINALPLWQEVEYVKASNLFGEYWIGGDVQLPRRKYRHPDCRKAPTTYVPDSDLLLDAVLFVTGERNLSMGLYGHTGTGKSELPRFVSDKLNVPMLQFSLTESTREDKLMGTYLIKDGETYFDLGTVARAYDENSVGYLLVIDEIDKGNDIVIAKAHDIADYKPFTIDDTGEVFKPHDNFRLLVTGQTSGNGDVTGIYNVQRLDRAFVARFFWVRAKYPNKKVLSKILSTSFARLGHLTIELMADYYELAVQALENTWLESNGKDCVEILAGNVSSISTPVSIRLMKGWADLVVKYGDLRSVREAYDRCIGMSCEDDDRYALDLMLEATFGKMLDEPGDVAPIEVKYPESEMQNIKNVDFGVYVHMGDENSKRKMWLIGADERGSHTFYTHPETNELTYYHKSLDKFEDGYEGVRTYCSAKIDEKLEKGYVHKSVVNYDPDADKNKQFTPVKR